MIDLYCFQDQKKTVGVIFRSGRIPYTAGVGERPWRGRALEFLEVAGG